ncbi:MAG: hypothetical protein ACPGOV_15520 [Magnetovibrionaceae bacterium]
MINHGLIAGGVALFLLAACTQTPTDWQKSGLTTSETQSAVRSCRRWAMREAERDMALMEGRGAPDPLGRSSGYDRNMAVYQAGKNTRTLTAECLRRQGFRPQESQKSESQKSESQ